MIQIDIYLKEISDFLQTVTIKNVEFASIMKQKAMDALGVPDISDIENPYYLNLNGEYSMFDEPMYVTSLDTYEKIIFSKENLILHNKTRTAYNITSNFYKKLCIAYPNQTDLIKNIRYPVADINDAISADDFTVLNYDTSTLESREISSIVTCIEDYAAMLYQRWYIKEFNYEEYYPIIFWAVMWYYFNLVILLQRIRNTRTSDVHSFHIKEYLSSKGLSKYIPYLTDKQSLFLYQNINYILKNRGKQSTFDILISKLFTEIGGSIENKTIYLSKENSTSTLKLTPKIITEAYTATTVNRTDINEGDITDLGDFERTLNTYENVEPFVDDAFIEAQAAKFNIQPKTVIPTKFLEIAEIRGANSFDNMLKRFIIESHLYLIREGLIDIVYTLMNSYVSDIILTNNETLALLHYCALRMDNEDVVPDILPKLYGTPFAFKASTPTLLSDIENKFTYNGNEYYITNYINVEDVLSTLSSGSRYCVYDSDFEELMVNQLDVLYDYFNIASSTADGIVIEAMNNLFNQLFVRDYQEVSLIPDCTTYTEWFNKRDNIKNLITTVEANVGTNYDKWYDLFVSLSNSGLQLDSRVFNKYGNINDSQNDTLMGLKELLIHLSSYNICILDKPYDKSFWLNAFTPKQFYKGSDHITRHDNFSLILDIEQSLNSTNPQDDMIIGLNISSDLNASHASEVEMAIPDVTSAYNNSSSTQACDITLGFQFDFSDITPNNEVILTPIIRLEDYIWNDEDLWEEWLAQLD